MRTSPLTLAAILLVASTVRAESDRLHEGETASVGHRTDGASLARAKVDLAIFPYPGGGEMWGGPINATRAEATFLRRKDGSFDAEEARLAFIRWPHLHVLALERDVRLGTTAGVELAGLYLPYVTRGHAGADRWAIAHVGAGAGYRWLRKVDRAREDGHMGSVTVDARLDDQAPVGSGPLSVRGSFDLAYTFALGKIEDQTTLAFAHALVLDTRAGLYVDLGPGAPTRTVARTDPTTGAVTYRRHANEGQRWRALVCGLSLELRPFDTLSTSTPVAAVEVGMSHEF